MADCHPTLSALSIARFWSSVQVEPSNFQCWEWRSTFNHNGYGRFHHDGRWLAAHRVAYELVVGIIPAGNVIRHRCDNPKCCNPAHLLVGTTADNAQDAVERGRTASGAKSGRTKLLPEDVAYIRRNPDKLTLKALAGRFGMAASSVHYIRCGRSWKKLVGGEGLEPPTYGL